MRSSRQLLLSVAVVLAGVATLATTAAAEDASNGLPGEWMSRYSSARTIGLGGAFVSSADEPLGSLWNPAGLYQLSQNQLQFETSRYFEDTSVNGFGFVVPASRFPTLGLTVLSLNSGSFERTDELNQSLGEFNQSDLAFLISASKQLNNRFAVGTNVKVVRQQFEDFNSTGVGFDVGALAHLSHGFVLGASVLNIGGPTIALRAADETFPTEIRGGISYHFLGGRGLMSAEMHFRDGPGTTAHLGSEVWVHDKMAIRVGYDQAAGAGVGYQVMHAMRFDYGVSNHELGFVHRVGLTYNFGGFFARSYATPAVFSPMGENSVTKFNIQSRTKDEASEWKLEIFDKHNERVRYFGGKNVPPAHVMWDGKDDTGLTLPDGVYRYVLTVVDAGGRVIRAEEKTVEILTSGPQGSVPLIVE